MKYSLCALILVLLTSCATTEAPKAITEPIQTIPDIDFSNKEFVIINKASDQSIKALQEFEKRDKTKISFSGAATQKDFDSIIKSNPWIKDLGMMAWNEHILNIDAVSTLQSLKSLQIWINMPKNSALDLTPIGKLENLTTLKFSNTHLKNINALSTLTKLESVEFFRSEVDSIDFLEKTPYVKNVMLWGDNTLKNLKPLATLKFIEDLNIQRNPKATDHDLAELKNITTLKYLIMTDSKDVTNLEFLKKNKNLRQINADQCSNLRDINALKDIQSIEKLSLSGTSIKDLSALTGKHNLKSLKISETQVKDVKILSSLEKLEYLDISETEIIDITPLMNLKTLRSLTINKKIPQEQISNLKKIIPSLIIETESYK